MAVAQERSPVWLKSAVRLPAIALRLAAIAWTCAGCTGGPHPLPPERLPDTASVRPGPAFGTMATAGSSAVAPVVSRPTDNPSQLLPPAATPQPSTAGTAALSGPAAAGATAAGAAGTGAAPTSGTSAGNGAAAPMAPGALDDGCQASTVVPRASDAAPDGVLFMVDRSADMALDFRGEPRWQLSGHALVGALTPIASATLRVGAIFYPSSASSTSTCIGPEWLCPRVPATEPTAAPTCAVNSLTAADQLGFQPASQALAALSASSQLYQPIAGVGVPLRESIERANAALAGAALTGRMTVVLMVNAQPSCRWSEPQTSGLVAGWRAQRRIDTHVIALPGANDQSMGEFAALAQAGGQPRVIAPANAAALQSALQSIVAGSLTSCTLELDPAVSAPNQAHVIVGVQGVEQEVPRTSDTGEPLWTISDDGKQLMLLGKLCTAASGGDYDSLRVAVGCVHLPALVP